MDWREMAGNKLMSPQEAVQVIGSGEVVGVAPINVTPFTLCQALYDRRSALEGVSIYHPAALFPWVRPGEEDAFQTHELYATPANRDMVNADHVWYKPTARFRQDEIPAGLADHYDAFLVPVSPPDRHGYCSFGPGVFYSPAFCRNSTTVIAEVHENFMRTGGDNFIHISQLDRICEAAQATGGIPTAPLTEEETMVAEVVCTLVAAELVNDRDNVQIGIGTISSVMAMYLGGKHDLGIQTELVTPGVADLVYQGVATGKYKNLHVGKVVGSIIVVPEEELALIDSHPAFELYDFGYVDDIRLLVQHDNLVAINNALMVDLTGQVASETIGPRVLTGVGGQTAFAIAANYSKGGRSITVLPSSHIIDGQRVSRIVPSLPEAAVVTVPRTLVDNVVTEHGIATLRGKSIRERIGELIAIAHPDFRAELKSEAKRLHNVDI